MTAAVTVVSALAGVLGVGTGALLQARNNHRRWLRDQELHAAAEFITATSEIYDHRLHGTTGDTRDDALWQRVQKSRSELYLLCRDPTVKVAEALVQGVRHVEPRADGSQDDALISILREFVRRIRRELNTGKGKAVLWTAIPILGSFGKSTSPLPFRPQTHSRT